MGDCGTPDDRLSITTHRQHMYQLYIANKNYSSWSLRPWILMHTLNIPFEEHLNAFGSGSNWAEFRQFSPTGQVPCLVDDQQVIWDSLAITEYLAEKHTSVWPQLSAARAWARCASAEMHAGFMALRNQCPMTCGLRIQRHTVDQALTHDIKRFDELWNQGLDTFGGPYLAGSTFTAVDAFFAPVAFRVQTYGLNISPKAQSYVDLLLTLDGMQTWYQQALEEPWREPGHEQEALDCGIITEDFRQS